MSFVTHKRSVAGFSFTEAVIVVAMFSLLMFVVMDIIASFYRYNAYSIAQSYEISNARRGIESLVGDLREMTYADDGTFPIATTSEYLIGFYSDIDKDDSVEYVEYELASTTLTKRVYNATGSPPVYEADPSETDTVSEYVQNIDQGTSTFRYYDYAGVETTSTSTVTDVRYIEVMFIVNVDPVRAPGEFQLRSSAAPRNLRDNI